ncbi:MAG TPA: hypothetical protein EYO84_06900 [Planctomycetes bacterium]|nr:hypothetical protein [Planctomycetota bacterium]
MFKVDDRVFITRGLHQNETAVVTAIDDWSGVLTVNVDGWPGKYNINPAACIPIMATHTVVTDELDDLLDHIPTWTH